MLGIHSYRPGAASQASAKTTCSSSTAYLFGAQFKLLTSADCAAPLQAGARRWATAAPLPAAAAAVPLPRRRPTARLQPRAAAAASGSGSRNAVLEREAASAAPLAGLAAPLPERGLAGTAGDGPAEQQPSSAFHAAGGVLQQAEDQRPQHVAQQQDQQQQQQQQQPLAAAHGAAGGTATAAQALPPAAEAAAEVSEAQPSALWALAMMTLGYLHLSVTLYALPSLVPFIAQDLLLDDTQGALLTTGYTILYGLVLVPMGIIADSANRPRLLAGGIALWSLLTMSASQSQSFGQLIASRIGFAAAQATCNPVAYSLIPELFPKNRTAAMAVYNTAIYLGRAGAFAVLLAAGHSAGQAAAVDAADPAWRSVLWALGPPGLLLAAVALLTVRESREQDGAGRFLPLVTLSRGSVDGGDAAGGAAAPAPAMVSAPASAAPRDLPSALAALRGLLSNRSFMALTGATAFGDVASWALIAWQGLYYERVLGLEPEVYAPLIAGGICIGGIVGGIGSGLFGDRLTSKGKRAWLTAGTSVAAAPLMAASFLLPDYKQSFVALLVGYALSECWRAPAAVMVREVAPAGLGSTAGALNLCVRGLAGALGPVGIAQLSAHVGLQSAMMLIPACHIAAGLSLAATEGVIAEEKAKAKAAKSH